MQRYTLSVKKKHGLLAVLMAVLFLCRCSSGSPQQADAFALQLMDSFFHYEARWAEAIAQNNPESAKQSLDSMQSTLNHFYDQAHQYPWPRKDSIYFLSVAVLAAELDKLLQHAYPEVARLAFLPPNLYAREKEIQLITLLRYTDSIIAHHTQTIALKRNQFLLHHNPSFETQ